MFKSGKKIFAVTSCVLTLLVCAPSAFAGLGPNWTEAAYVLRTKNVRWAEEIIENLNKEWEVLKKSFDRSTASLGDLAEASRVMAQLHSLILGRRDCDVVNRCMTQHYVLSVVLEHRRLKSSQPSTAQKMRFCQYCKSYFEEISYMEDIRDKAWKQRMLESIREIYNDVVTDVPWMPLEIDGMPLQARAVVRQVIYKYVLDENSAPLNGVST